MNIIMKSFGHALKKMKPDWNGRCLECRNVSSESRGCGEGVCPSRLEDIQGLTDLSGFRVRRLADTSFKMWCSLIYFSVYILFISWYYITFCSHCRQHVMAFATRLTSVMSFRVKNALGFIHWEMDREWSITKRVNPSKYAVDDNK